jgi:hypothetical protein
MTLRSRVNSKAFEANYDAIFGEGRKPQRGAWVQDSETGEFIPKSEFHTIDPDAPTVLRALDEFISPIDGQRITDRGQLRRHNERHGVTNMADYGENYFDRKATERAGVLSGNTRQAKNERVETIKRAIEMHENR